MKVTVKELNLLNYGALPGFSVLAAISSLYGVWKTKMRRLSTAGVVREAQDRYNWGRFCRGVI